MYILSYSRHGDIIVYEVTEVHLPPAHHSHRPSHIHCFIVSFQAPTRTAFSDYTGPDLLCSTVFHFSYFVFSF